MYLLGGMGEWEDSAARRALNPILASMNNLPSCGAHSTFVLICIISGVIILSTSVALLLSVGPEVTLSDVAQRLQTVHGNDEMPFPSGSIFTNRKACTESEKR